MCGPGKSVLVSIQNKASFGMLDLLVVGAALIGIVTIRAAQELIDCGQPADYHDDDSSLDSIPPPIPPGALQIARATQQEELDDDNYSTGSSCTDDSMELSLSDSELIVNCARPALARDVSEMANSFDSRPEKTAFINSTNYSFGAEVCASATYQNSSISSIVFKRSDSSSVEGKQQLSASKIEVERSSYAQQDWTFRTQQIMLGRKLGRRNSDKSKADKQKPQQPPRSANTNKPSRGGSTPLSSPTVSPDPPATRKSATQQPNPRTVSCCANVPEPVVTNQGLLEVGCSSPVTSPEKDAPEISPSDVRKLPTTLLVGVDCGTGLLQAEGNKN